MVIVMTKLSASESRTSQIMMSIKSFFGAFVTDQTHFLVHFRR